ncbi:MAG: ketopantoate reductase family protein [Bacteroidia bacterium]
MESEKKIIIYGAGAIGCTLAAWLSEKHEHVYLLCRGESAKQISEKGLRIYGEGNSKNLPIKVIESIDEVENPDVIALAVKNYSLPAIVQSLKGKIKQNTVILGLQNGVANQRSLSPLASGETGVEVIFGVLAYNAWLDKPGVVGYQHKGVLVIGSYNNNQQQELKNIAAIFNKGIETFIAKDWRNVAHTKLLINLGNSITTLLGRNFQSTNRPDLLQKIISNMMLEGMNILKAEGIKEEHIKGLPSWTLLKASAVLPQLITAPLFRKNLKKMGMSSMAQDIFSRNTTDTELDDINGYLLSLADKHKMPAPYNRVVYRLCKKNFSENSFQGLSVEEVWNEINSK